MVSFQRYFEKRVEELLNTNGSQVFFVFRGFGIEQLHYLINHPNSIFKDKELLKGECLDLSVLEDRKSVV